MKVDWFYVRLKSFTGGSRPSNASKFRFLCPQKQKEDRIDQDAVLQLHGKHYHSLTSADLTNNDKNE